MDNFQLGKRLIWGHFAYNIKMVPRPLYYLYTICMWTQHWLRFLSQVLIVRFFFILGIESFIFWLLDLTRNLSYWTGSPEVIYNFYLFFHNLLFLDEFYECCFITTASNRDKGIRNEPAKTRINQCLLLLS